VVVDHFGWPTDPRQPNLADHVERLAPLAAASNVATRIDAIGTVFGDWTASQVRPWLLAVTEMFGTDRCMLGSDLPIENLRSGFGQLYGAYDDIFSDYSDDERAMLFHRTADHWYVRS
jgi:predicted TIM-barrel fold metal-dependent hydrolase